MSDENVKKSSKRRKNAPREDMPLNELDAIAAQTRQEMIEENQANPRHQLPDEMVCKRCAKATVLVEGGRAGSGGALLVHCSQLHGLVLGGEISDHITSCSSWQKIELLPLEPEPEQEV